MKQLLLAGVLIAVLAACSSSSSTTPAATTTTTSTSAAPATTTTTGAPAQVPQVSPDTAAKALLQAWEHGDRIGAARVATPAVVAQLFGTAPSSFDDRGCQTPTAGVSSCAFGIGNGQLVALHTVTIDGGWLVDGITIE